MISDNHFFMCIFSLLRPYRKRVFILTVGVVLTSLIAMFSPIINRRIIDDGIIAGNMKIVYQYTVFIIGLFILEQIIEFFELRQYTYMNNMLSTNLLLKAFKHTLKLKMSYLAETNVSKIMSEVSQDVSTISSITDRNVLVSVTQILRVVGGITGLVLINWKLTLFVLSIIPLKVLLTVLLSKKSQNTVKDMMDANSKFSFWYGETLSGISEIKLWNLYAKKINEFVKHQKRIIKLRIRAAYIDQTNQVSEMTLQAIIFNALYLLGAAMIINTEFTIGGMFSFVMYSSYVIQPISLLINLHYQFSKIKPAMERYNQFLSVEEESKSKNGSIKLLDDSFPSVIQFENVTLKYKDKIAIDNLSLEIKRGEKIGIIGMNGSGKSSLVNLLLRFYDPSIGRIIMDGKDISNINVNHYRELFAVMSQNVHLFNTTIEENIKMYKSIPEQWVVESCIKSDAMEFIRNLREKFKFVVGYRGAKLSGGERQKVALARVLAKNAKILVLDEATSSFDYESELLFNRVIQKNSSFHYIFVISHRPDILKSVDKILVLENGLVNGFGTYTELYGANRLFTEMMNNTCMPVNGADRNDVIEAEVEEQEKTEDIENTEQYDIYTVTTVHKEFNVG